MHTHKVTNQPTHQTHHNQTQRSIFNGYAMYISPELLARMPALTVVLENDVSITIPADQYTQVWRLGKRMGGWMDGWVAGWVGGRMV